MSAFAAGAALGAVVGCLVGAVATAWTRLDRERAIAAHSYAEGVDQGHAAGWVDGVTHEAARRATHPTARPHLTVVASERRN